MILYKEFSIIITVILFSFQPVDVYCSEPSRSPKLSGRKRYGYAPQSPEITNPTLPKKAHNKSGMIMNSTIMM